MGAAFPIFFRDKSQCESISKLYTTILVNLVITQSYKNRYQFHPMAKLRIRIELCTLRSIPKGLNTYQKPEGILASWFGGRYSTYIISRVVIRCNVILKYFRQSSPKSKSLSRLLPVPHFFSRLQSPKWRGARTCVVLKRSAGGNMVEDHWAKP